MATDAAHDGLRAVAYVVDELNLLVSHLKSAVHTLAETGHLPPSAFSSEEDLVGSGCFGSKSGLPVPSLGS